MQGDVDVHGNSDDDIATSAFEVEDDTVGNINDITESLDQAGTLSPTQYMNSIEDFLRKNGASNRAIFILCLLLTQPTTTGQEMEINPAVKPST